MPENDVNAIGGIINLETRSAFTAGRPFLNALASYGVYEQHGEVRHDRPSLRLAFATGRTFGDEDRWGIVGGSSYEQPDYDIPQVESASPSVREYARAGITRRHRQHTGRFRQPERQWHPGADLGPPVLVQQQQEAV